MHGSTEEREACDIDSEKLILRPIPSLPMLDASTMSCTLIQKAGNKAGDEATYSSTVLHNILVQYATNAYMQATTSHCSITL